MAEKTRIQINRDFVLGKVSDQLYGSFIEHLGRAVYTGIYQPDHPTADEEGFRKDVLSLVRELGVPIVRYPGGNYVSNFRWEDSVGPKEKRRPRLDMAWRTLESNQFGIQEFSKWCRKAGAEPMMAVNLGTRGVSDALNLLEFCNLDTPSYYADLRRQYGDEKPYGIHTWCLGNEMDGPWQMGHKNAHEYGHLAAETAKAMKMMDEKCRFVVCGSSSVQMPTFPQWEADVLDEAYDYVDYVSLHQYFNNSAGDTADFLAGTQDLETFLHTVIAACDFVKAKKRSKKDMMLSFDEWNCWYHSNAQDDKDMAEKPWRVHPHLLEDIYTYEDAIMNGLVLIRFLNHADRVKIACLAQLVNVIAPIMTQENGPAWRQTIYYPFLHASRYGRGTALVPVVKTGKHDTAKHEDVTDVEAAAVWNEEKEEVTLFAVNRSTKEAVPFEADFGGFEGYRVKEYLVLENTDMHAVNGPEGENVFPKERTDYTQEGGRVSALMQPVSWNVIRLAK